jgi:hypothetical protein
VVYFFHGAVSRLDHLGLHYDSIKKYSLLARRYLDEIAEDI